MLVTDLIEWCIAGPISFTEKTSEFIDKKALNIECLKKEEEVNESRPKPNGI
jgi:hypothetical protein